MRKVILDIWGGDLSQVHVARFVVPLNEALLVARQELEAGFLINMRLEKNWTSWMSFDTRNQPGLNRRNHGRDN